MGPLSYIYPSAAGAPKGHLESVCSSGRPEFCSILLTLPGRRTEPTYRPSELLRTASAKDWCRYGSMRKKRRRSRDPARATIASITREMLEPRLAKSVRDDPRYQVVLAAERTTRSG
jgi:hypothetical protein